MFRFTILDLLWLTLVVAITSIWFTDHQSLTHQAAVMRNEQQALIHAIIEKGYLLRLEDDGTFSLISPNQIPPWKQ